MFICIYIYILGEEKSSENMTCYIHKDKKSIQQNIGILIYSIHNKAPGCNRAKSSLHHYEYVQQDGPLLVVNGVITPLNGRKYMGSWQLGLFHPYFQWRYRSLRK